MKELFFVATACALACTSQAFIINFNYSQTDQTTGSGTIAPFSFMGHDFSATAMPSATVLNPGATLANYVGQIVGMSGAANEANQAVGLLWSGSVTATASDGWTIQIPLVFVAKQTQTPADVSDYTWSVSYGDNPAIGVDAVGTGLRFAFYLSRDTVIDAIETPNTFQRYTQLTQNFVAGQDSFVNLDTTTAAIKDATDAGAPAGTDAAGRNLEFYWAWRDGGSLSSGSIPVDTFTVGGLLNADEATLMQPVPEPSTLALGAVAGLMLLLTRWRRRS